jgi:hypothetical protein
MPRNNKRLAVDQLIAEELQGSEKLRALLIARYGTIQKYAQGRGFYPEQVHQTLSNARPYPEVRDALALDLGLPRPEIDQLLDVAA